MPETWKLGRMREQERIAALERRFDRLTLWTAAVVVFFACLHTYGHVTVASCVTCGLWAMFAWMAVRSAVFHKRERGW